MLETQTNINSSFPFSLSLLFDQDCFGAEFGIKLHSGWDKYCLSCLPGVQSAQSGWPPIPVSPAAAASPVTEANAPPAYSQLQQVAG